MSGPTRVLFVCTHNAARSQMAEGFLRALGGSGFEVASAGTEARGLHPFAIQAMAEVGIDIAMQESKTLDRYLDLELDLVVTVCDAAAEACPVFPNARELRHWSFPDPTLATGDDDQRFMRFVSVRDAIAERIVDELLRQTAPDAPGRLGARDGVASSA